MRGPWFRLFRPVTLAPVLVIAVVFGLMGLGHTPTGDQWWHILLAGILLVVANGCSNLVNQTSPMDLTADRENVRTRNRPVASGELEQFTVLSVAVIGWLSSIVVAALFLPAMFVVVDGLVLLFAWVYSWPPYTKKYLGVNMVALATPRGGLGIAAAWVVYGSILSPTLWMMLALTVPLVTFGNSAKDIEDVVGDRKAGIETLATRWGEGAARLSTVLGVVWPMVVVLAWHMYIANPWLLLYAIPMAVTMVGSLRWRGEKLWSRGFYGTYAMLALLLGTPTLLAVVRA